MDPTNYAKHLILALLVIAWCILHSAMISVSVTEFCRKRLGHKFRFYRLFFNLVAILTLVPVAVYADSIQTQAIFQWHGYLRLLQVLLIAIAALLFFLGGQRYNLRQLLGVNQLREKTSDKAPGNAGELDTSGVLEITRHPWYLAAILLIWARPMDASAVIVNVILTCYLIVGTYLEEKKLVLEFGDQYKAYQNSVSMLIPYKWLTSTLVKRSRD